MKHSSIQRFWRQCCLWLPAIVFMGTAGCQSILGIDDVSARGPDSGAPNNNAPDSGDAPDGGENPLDTACPATIYNQEYGGHRYMLSINDLRYDEAVAECFRLGGYLATVDDAGENQFLTDMFVDDTWIGYDDLLVEDRYEWVVGASTYSNWHDGEPNDTNSEDCVAIYKTSNTPGTWNDFSCGDQRPYICECEPGLEPRAVPSCMADPAYNRILEGRRYRRFATTSTWQEARDLCLADGADLVVISDQDEDDRLWADISSDIWLGLLDPSAEGGSFEWIIGDATYRNWDSGEPNNYSGEHHAMMDSYSGRWSDISETSPRTPMCECDPESPAKNH